MLHQDCAHTAALLVVSGTPASSSFSSVSSQDRSCHHVRLGLLKRASMSATSGQVCLRFHCGSLLENLFTEKKLGRVAVSCLFALEKLATRFFLRSMVLRRVLPAATKATFT